MLHAVIYKGEDGWWVAEVPALPGCVSQGRTREEARQNIAEAAELWLETAREFGDPVPTGDDELEAVPLKLTR